MEKMMIMKNRERSKTMEDDEVEEKERKKGGGRWG